MVAELQRIEHLLIKLNGQRIEHLTSDKECEAYLGFNFKIGHLNLKFRKAKVTPKKAGLFVTLWKRNNEMQTEPFDEKDGFDFYVMVAEEGNQFGAFFFPRQVLSEKQILTSNAKGGKRGFRVYPDWTKPENKQAEKTQSWQSNYFIDLTHDEFKRVEKLGLIMAQAK